MTEEHGCGASLDQGTVVDDQGTHREAVVASAAMVAVAGKGGVLACARQRGSWSTWAFQRSPG